jgi:hypothetical protein
MFYVHTVPWHSGIMKRTNKINSFDSLLQRARKPSNKVAGQPRIRPCAACGEERMIVTRGICDKCRKKEERMEAGLNNPAYGDKKSKETGMKLLAKLLELMGKAALLRANRERVLQEFMPFLGISPETQRTLIREMTGPGLGDVASPFGRLHGGSSVQPEAEDDYGRAAAACVDGWTDDESVEEKTEASK